jgi:hypothetical protein
MLGAYIQDHNDAQTQNILDHSVMASYQCSGPIYRIIITRPYNGLLAHHVMASYQCSGQDHNEAHNSLLAHHTMASYQCSDI